MERTQSLKRLLRENARRAYEEELRRALSLLADDFDGWRAGKLDSGELSARVHAFHQGPAREIWSRYHTDHPEFAVAYAIRAGILAPEDVPPEVMQALRPMLDLGNDPTTPGRVGDVEPEGDAEDTRN